MEDVEHDDPREITEDVTIAPDAKVPEEVEERLEEERDGEHVGE